MGKHAFPFYMKQIATQGIRLTDTTTTLRSRFQTETRFFRSTGLEWRVLRSMSTFGLAEVFNIS